MTMDSAQKVNKTMILCTRCKRATEDPRYQPGTAWGWLPLCPECAEEVGDGMTIRSKKPVGPTETKA